MQMISSDMHFKLIELLREDMSGFEGDFSVEMAKHLIANNVTILPCKIGDPVYIVEYGVATRTTLTEVEIDEDGMWLCLDVPDGNRRIISARAIGKIAFVGENAHKEVLRVLARNSLQKGE